MHRAVLEILCDCYLDQVHAEVQPGRVNRTIEAVTGVPYSGEISIRALRRWARRNRLWANRGIVRPEAIVKFYEPDQELPRLLSRVIHDGEKTWVKWEYIRKEIPIGQILYRPRNPDYLDYLGYLKSLTVAIPDERKLEVLEAVMRHCAPLAGIKFDRDLGNHAVIEILRRSRIFRARRRGIEDDWRFKYKDGNYDLRMLVPRRPGSITLRWGGSPIAGEVVDLSPLIRLG